MGRTHSQTTRRVRDEQARKRAIAEANRRRKIAEQAVLKEEENAARMFLLQEKHPRVRLVFTPEDRLGVLANYLEEVTPGFDRAQFELNWEMWVSGKITKAEVEADLFVARHEQAEREAALLEGVAPPAGAGLIVP